MPFFLVRVLAVVWNILMFVENPKTWMASFLCPQGARLDVHLDEQTTQLISLSLLSPTHFQQREGLFCRSLKHTWEFPTHLKANPFQGSFWKNRGPLKSYTPTTFKLLQLSQTTQFECLAKFKCVQCIRVLNPLQILLWHGLTRSMVFIYCFYTNGKIYIPQWKRSFIGNLVRILNGAQEEAEGHNPSAKAQQRIWLFALQAGGWWTVLWRV